MVKGISRFMKWLDLDKAIPDAQKFLLAECLVLFVIGVCLQCNAAVTLPRVDEDDLLRYLPVEKLEMRTLEVPTSPAPKKEKPQPRKSTPRVYPVSKTVIARLINVESSNNDRALGDKKDGVYRAYGCLQLWSCYVEEVNRIFGTSYAHDDAFNRDKAIEMAELLIGRRAYCYQEKGYVVNEELLVRLHRLPYSPFSKSNDAYWLKYKIKNGLI